MFKSLARFILSEDIIKDKRTIASLQQEVFTLRQKINQHNHEIIQTEKSSIPFTSRKTTKFLHSYSKNLIKQVSNEMDIDYNLILAIANHESSLNPFAVRIEPHLLKQEWFINVLHKHKHDINDLWTTYSFGLMQILYVNILDQEWTIQPYLYNRDYIPQLLIGESKFTLGCGIKHLKGLLGRYTLEESLSAYNAGIPTSRNYDTYVKPIIERSHNARS